jgi:glycosyltransferase A (GT-A) superfamily protein (DUF2064 family)
MTQQKHALSLFTKSPQPGITKTRLTERLGGPLTDAEAAQFYRVTLLDVADAIRAALQICRQKGSEGQSYDFVVSGTPESEIPRLQELFRAEFPDAATIRYIIDRGRTFDEHFNDHYQQLFAQGYRSVVCVGGDLPTVAPEFLHRAFQWLAWLDAGSEQGGMVIAPCQAAGVSLVGLTADADMDFTGVFYNQRGTSALEAIVSIAKARGVPTTMLEALPDVDNTEDLAHTIAVLKAMAYAMTYQTGIFLPRRTLAWIQENRLVVTTPPNTEHDPRGEIDDTH